MMVHCFWQTCSTCHLCVHCEFMWHALIPCCFVMLIFALILLARAGVIDPFPAGVFRNSFSLCASGKLPWQFLAF